MTSELCVITSDPFTPQTNFHTSAIKNELNETAYFEFKAIPVPVK